MVGNKPVHLHGPTYRSFAHFTKGARHEKQQLDCQDYAYDYDNYADEKLAVAIVADGHGSSRFFRSGTGSRLVVECAMSGIKEFVTDKTFPAENNSNAEIHDKLRRLASSIIGSWKEAVETDEKDHPIKDDAKTLTLEDKYKNRYLNNPEPKYIHQAYGTTLIAVAMTENYWFGFHIGDGKCEVLFDNGEWAQPIPWDQKCFLNATTSICDDNALLDFRYWFGYRNSNGDVFEFNYGPDSDGIDSTKKTGAVPAAIFIGSDGVDDTYPVYENEKHMKYLYRLIVLNIAKDGFESTKNQISDLVKKLAESGSQDDVSMAGIVGELPSKLIEYLRVQDESDRAEENAIAERKKAEAEKHALQAEQARAEKQQAELRKKAQSAEQNLEQKPSPLSSLQEEQIEAPKHTEGEAVKHTEFMPSSLDSVHVGKY